MIEKIIRFVRSIKLNEILTADYSGSWASIVSAVRDPQANLPLALTIFAVATLLVTMVFMTAVVLFMGGDDDEDEEADGAGIGGGTVGTIPSAVTQTLRSPRSRYVSAALWVAFAALVWAATGWATSSDAVCSGCHSKTVHTNVSRSNSTAGPKAHDGIRCVSCHETASLVRRYGWETVPRTAHFIRGFLNSRGDEYGIIGTSACLSCHSAVTQKTITNAERGVKMSHRAPIEARWTCLDCHVPVAGEVGAPAGGMTKCVSCHDGKTAATACGTCHTGDISAAKSPADTIGMEPQVLVPNPECSGCHNLKKSCDPCHGIRLPHTGPFLAGGHARDYVESLWYGDGKACSKCHTEQRRPCSGCHQSRFPGHAITWAKDHQTSIPRTETCDGCHNGTAGRRPGRNICIDLCHTDRQEWR